MISIVTQLTMICIYTFQGEPVEDSGASPCSSPADALDVVGTRGADGTASIYNREDRHI
jgi:hypothetical protein